MAVYRRSRFMRSAIRFACAAYLVFWSGLIDLPPQAHEATPLELPELVVTASRIPTTVSDLTRSIRIIDRGDIENAPARSVQEILQYAVGVDLRQRGPLGAQADVSVRGGTFEQTLILIDGIKVNDSQTGHHNLDIPLTLNDVDRIEILEGHGSRQYGPGAFGGVINIITRRDQSTRLDLGAALGEFGLARGDISVAQSAGPIAHRLSVSGSRTAGHREHTDSRILTAFWQGRLVSDRGEVAISLGHTNKLFGANGYYSDQFLNEWEHTITTFSAAQGRLALGDWQLSPRVYWRRHKDDFVLDRARPDWYRNRHTTDSQGLELSALRASRLGTTSLAAEISRDQMGSSNLGDRSRRGGGVSLEHRLNLAERATLVPGASAYWYPGRGWITRPGVDLGYNLNTAIRIHASGGHSFRLPTYTELYYDSPANKGNVDLKPEEAWTYEAGLRVARADVRANLVLFRRSGQDQIDWVRTDATSPWLVRNATNAVTRGFGLAVAYGSPAGKVRKGLARLRVGYSFLDAAKTSERFESKYLLDHLKHLVSVDMAGDLGNGLKQSWKYSYRRRAGYGGHHLLDARLAWYRGWAEVFLKATNVLNVAYSDIGSIRMPGRWISIGVEFSAIPGR